MEKEAQILDRKSIAICTALPGGSVDVQYMKSITELVSSLEEQGYSPYTISSMDPISTSKAKNFLISVALKEPNLHGVLLVSPDQSFDPKDVVDMIKSGKNVIAAASPTKYVNWDQVRSAALMGRDNLELYSGSFSLEFLPGDEINFSLNTPFKVKTISSNLMYISKESLEKLKSLCSSYINSSMSSEDKEEVCEYFYTSKNDENILIFEDFNFCNNWRSLGEDVWVAPWVKVQQSGSFRFVGSFSHSLELSSRVSEITKANRD